MMDGERAFLRAMRVPLEQDGSKVRAANDGPSGLALVQSQVFDLVLLNVMPSGLELCRQMRRVSTVPSIMFGSPRPEDVVGSLAAGADDYGLHPSALCPQDQAGGGRASRAGLRTGDDFGQQTPVVRCSTDIAVR